MSQFNLFFVNYNLCQGYSYVLPKKIKVMVRNMKRLFLLAKAITNFAFTICCHALLFWGLHWVIPIKKDLFQIGFTSLSAHFWQKCFWLCSFPYYG